MSFYFFLRGKRHLGMKITALKSKIQDSKVPQETWARKEMNTSLTGNYTAGPFWSARIVAVEAATSNSFVPWNWIGETTYKTHRNRRNLTSGRDLEGELIHRGSIFSLRRFGRLRHRSSSTTTASPPSPSIPSTSHIHLVVIPY